MPRDPGKALDLYKQAANQGLTLAQYQLGLMYFAGQDVANDPVQAHMWMSLALKGLPAGVFRDDAVNALKDLTGRMSAGQLTDAERLAKEWRQTKE